MQIGAASRRSTAARLLPGTRWPYTSTVTWIDECPVNAVKVASLPNARLHGERGRVDTQGLHRGHCPGRERPVVIEFHGEVVPRARLSAVQNDVRAIDVDHGTGTCAGVAEPSEAITTVKTTARAVEII
jgi:hypothetical protein